MDREKELAEHRAEAEEDPEPGPPLYVTVQSVLLLMGIQIVHELTDRKSTSFIGSHRRGTTKSYKGL